MLVGDLPATDLDPDPAEVSATRLTSLTALRQQLSQLPETFTPWLGQALDLVSPP